MHTPHFFIAETMVQAKASGWPALSDDSPAQGRILVATVRLAPASQI